MGVLVATFQFGWGENILDFQSNGGIAFWLPIFMFVILFGLSMDYHVFILSRIREAYDRGMSTGDAVAHGIKTTAGVVSSAAIVMVGVFAIFATLPIIDMKEMGIGLAAAVLIDATIVRAVLLPGDDEAARRLELVPADAGSSGCRGSSITASPRRRRRRCPPPPSDRMPANKPRDFASQDPGRSTWARILCAPRGRRTKACASPHTGAGGDHSAGRRSGDAQGRRESPGPTSTSAYATELTARGVRQTSFSASRNGSASGVGSAGDAAALRPARPRARRCDGCGCRDGAGHGRGAARGGGPVGDRAPGRGRRLVAAGAAVRVAAALPAAAAEAAARRHEPVVRATGRRHGDPDDAVRVRGHVRAARLPAAREDRRRAGERRVPAVGKNHVFWAPGARALPSRSSASSGAR